MSMIVTGAIFGADQAQIMFMEQRHQSESGSLEQTLVVELDDKGRQLIQEIQEALEEIVDGYMLSVRNPPETLDRRPNRFLEKDDEVDEG